MRDDVLIRQQVERIHGKAAAAGTSGRDLLFSAARAIALQEQASTPGNGPPAPYHLTVVPSASKPAGTEPSARQAAAAATPSPPAAPTPGAQILPSVQQPAAARALSGPELLALVPAQQRPFVMFTPRSFLTQAARQQVVNRLTGRYLELLLKELQVPTARQEQVVISQLLLCKAAATAALDTERTLYRRITNPDAYHRDSPKLEPDATTIPNDTWQELRAVLGLTDKQQQQRKAEEQAPQTEAAGLEEEQQPKRTRTDEGGGAGGLQDAEEQIEHITSSGAAPTGARGEGGPREGLRPVAKEEARGSQQDTSLATAEALALEAEAQAQVKAQVRSFVQSLVKPYVQSGAVCAGTDKRLINKAVEKILGKHTGCKDAGFLLAEHAAVAKLVESLVRHSKQSS